MPTKPAAPRPAAPKALPAPADKTPAQLAGDSPHGTSNRALMLRRQLQNMDVDFQVPAGAKPFLHSEQMALIQQPTPKPYIKSKPGRGGKSYSYVPIALTVERLNMIFCYGWSFKVTDKGLITDSTGAPISAWVLGDLTITAVDGSQLMKSAFGGADVETYGSGPKAGRPLSVADNFKSAESDAIGKAASMFGLWLDLYDKDGDILQERIAAATQTEAAIASAATADAGSRTVEGRAVEVRADPAPAVIPDTNGLLFDDPHEPASSAQAEADLDLMAEEPPQVDEAELAEQARQAEVALAEERVANARAAAAAAAAKAKAAAPAKPAAPEAQAAAPTKPASKWTPEQLKAISEEFYTKAAKMGWGTQGAPQKANVQLIEKVLTGHALWPLKMSTMETALQVLADEAAKRRAARTAAPVAVGHA